MRMTLTLKQSDLDFVGKKSIPVPAGKKKALASFFFFWSDFGFINYLVKWVH